MIATLLTATRNKFSSKLSTKVITSNQFLRNNNNLIKNFAMATTSVER